MKLWLKLSIGFAVIIFAFVLSVAYSWFLLENVREDSNELIQMMTHDTQGFVSNDNILSLIKKAQRHLQETHAALIWGIMVSVFFAAALAHYLTQLIVSPLKRATTIADAIKKGDFSMRFGLQSTDELGQLSHSIDNMLVRLNALAEVGEDFAQGNFSKKIHLLSSCDMLGIAFEKMSANLNRLISSIEEAANHVSSGSVQVSNASQSLSKGATEQAASLEEISNSLTEIGSQTKTNAENATLANNLTTKAGEIAAIGGDRMEEMMAAMEDIENSSKEVVKIVKVIDDIAFQTNLLALNAAVEAARAGRHGKGFAVVAEEVRNLAARSAKAARETAEGIKESIEKIERGTSVAMSTADALHEIVDGISQVNGLVKKIAAASNEQAEAVQQVSIGLNQIDNVTQQRTANAEETASASFELSTQASVVLRLLSEFKLKNYKSTDADKSLLALNKSLRLNETKAHRTEVERSSVRKDSSDDCSSKGLKKHSNAEKLLSKEQIVLDDAEFGRY